MYIHIQFSSVTHSYPTLCHPIDCSMPDFPVHHQLLSLLKLISIELGVAIQQAHPLLSPLLLSSIFPSIRVFSNELVLPIRWSKYWNFSFSIRPSSENSELISFTLDWLDLLDQTVQGTLKSLLQNHSSKESTLRCSVFFRVQLSQPSMTTGKTTALTRMDLASKVIHCLGLRIWNEG